MAQFGIDGAKQEIILVLNKVDLVTPKKRLLQTSRDIVSIINGAKLGPNGAEFAELDTTTFMISAQEDDGVIDLKKYLLKIAKPKKWVLSKEDGISDLTKDEFVEQMVLEMMLDHTHDEIPYEAGIYCKSIVDLPFDKIRIDVEILVANNRQQKMVVGEKGRTMLKIRQGACKHIENFFGRTVILYLWVNVRAKNDIITTNSL